MSRAAQIALPNPYRLPLFRPPDRELRRGLQAAGVVGLVVLAAVYLAPRRTAELTVEEVPERFAKLILEEPKAQAPQVKLPKAPEVVMETPKPPKVEAKTPTAQPAPKPKPVTERRQKTPTVAPDQGKVGRERAQEQVAQLDQVTQSLDRVLDDVSSSLASTSTGEKTRSTSRRRTRSGRGGAQVASLTPGVPSLGGAGSGAAIGGGSRIQVESLAEAGLPAPQANHADGSAAGRNEIRNDADLLAVVRKYAPGIQYCYDNELKKDGSLGGKLVVSITVAPSGQVTGANIVTDTVRSAAMNACALAQIEAWKFPRVPEGTVTFQAPFVFTPPE